MKKTRPILITVPIDLKEQLDNEAKHLNRSRIATRALRDAVNQYMKDRERGSEAAEQDDEADASPT